jgi:predicted RNase H-like nuclease (RuvC/YqgF family)
MNKIKLFTINLTIGISSILSCNETPKQKLEAAETEVAETQADLDTAKMDFDTEIAHYQRETNDKIGRYSKQLEDFKMNAANEKKLASKEFQKKISALEAKNSEMKKRISEFKADDKMGWYDFRGKCEYDMQCIDKDINNICNPTPAK